MAKNAKNTSTVESVSAMSELKSAPHGGQKQSAPKTDDHYGRDGQNAARRDTKTGKAHSAPIDEGGLAARQKREIADASNRARANMAPSHFRTPVTVPTAAPMTPKLSPGQTVTAAFRVAMAAMARQDEALLKLDPESPAGILAENFLVAYSDQKYIGLTEVNFRSMVGDAACEQMTPEDRERTTAVDLGYRSVKQALANVFPVVHQTVRDATKALQNT